MKIICVESEEFDPVAPILKKEEPKGKWDDEDAEEEDVKESWEDEDSAEVTIIHVISISIS